jgi:hypothetical protein
MLAVPLITGQASASLAIVRREIARRPTSTVMSRRGAPCPGETHRYQNRFTGGAGQPSPRPAALTGATRQLLPGAGQPRAPVSVSRVPGRVFWPQLQQAA